MVINAGNKADTLNVYTSTDGTTWTLAEGVTTTTSYTDYTVSFAESTKYIKFDVAGTQQVRIKYVTVTYVACPHTNTEAIGTPKDATCIEDGITAGEKCTACGQIITAQEDIPATGHIDTNPADSKCDTCGENMCTAHIWIDGEVITEGDCTTDRVIAQVCQNCDQPGTDKTITAPGHTEEIDAAVAATCTKSGLTEGKHCSVCSEVLVEQNVVPAAHKFGADGKCTVCGYAILAIDRDSFGEASGYDWHNWTATASTGESITGSGFIYGTKKESIQMNGSKDGDYIYNTAPIPGKLVSITLTKASNNDRNFYIFTSDTPYDSATFASLKDQATDATKLVTEDGVTWTFDTTDKYFAIVLTDSSAAYLSSIEIAYEPPTSSFENVNVSLGEDISVNYYIAKGDLVDPEMKFTINNYTKTVKGELKNDQYVFVFDGVAPQWIGDNIKAELIDGGSVVETKDYSVLTYLKALQTKTKEELSYSEDKYNKMNTLINDLLVYGGAAQEYVGHKTDALVSAGVTGSKFENLSETQKSVTDNGIYVQFVSANVFFDNSNKLIFTLTATNISAFTFKVKVNDQETVVTPVKEGEKYVIMTDGIKASAFSDVYTVTAYTGEKPGASVTYSVNSYVYAKQEDANEAFKALVHATYNYGAAAKAFIEAN